jgi:anti-sigma regulatory factor (Ser/Thr protein kinase)
VGLAALRRQLRRWLAAVGTDEDTASDVLLACGEAAANAVEHAFAGTAAEPGSTDPAGEHAFTASAAGPAGEFEVELRIGAGRELTLQVADTGRWRAVPAPGDRGRGLPMMRAVMDSVDVESGQNGTVVTMRRRLGVRA